jgi:FkbM family methyltransferase
MNSIYLIGLNQDALFLKDFAIKKNIHVVGFIDDFSKSERYGDMPIFKSEAASLKHTIVNCSSSIAPLETQKKFMLMGFNVIYMTEFLSDFNANILPPVFESFVLNAEKSAWLLKRMNSTISRKLLENVLKFRNTGEIRHMSDFKIEIHNQYLDFIAPYNPKSYIDVGGFDGDTTLLFIENITSIKKVYFFEPNVKNIELAKQRLANFDEIEYYNCGLGSEDTTAHITNSGSASSISQCADNPTATEVEVRRLDAMRIESCDVIKIDIEGFEMEFLKGARNFIKTHRPLIAIAVYHQPEDFFSITSYILDLVPDYKVDFRHYSEGWSESIMYFSHPATCVHNG